LMIEHENGYLLGAKNTHLLTDGSISQSFVDITNKFVYVDKGMNVIHFRTISLIGDWNVLLSKAFKYDSNTVLLTGIAYHEVMDEYRIGMIWIDTALNVLHDTVIGMENYSLNPHGWMEVNQKGNLVTYGTLFDKKEAFTLASPDHYFFMELDHDGSLIEFSEQVLAGTPYYLVPIGAEKYHMYGNNYTIIQLNSDFFYDTTFALNLPMENIFVPIRLQTYNYNTYFLLIEYIVDAGSDYFDSDLAVIIVDSMANILNTFAYGFADTTDRGTKVSCHHPDTLFVGGARNVQTFPIDSSYFNHLFVHKITISGEIVSTTFFGADGLVYMSGLLATDDGGCIMSGLFYDFLTYPDSNIRDAFFIKVNPDGTITRLEEENYHSITDNYVVFPNPVLDRLIINGADQEKTLAQLFNTKGVLLKSLEFDSYAEIDVSGFPSGAYLLQLLQRDGKSVTKKLMIKN